MTFRINAVAPSGGSYKATVERMADNFYRQDDAETFTSGLAFADKDIVMSEGSSENRGSYTVELDASTWDDGLYLVRIHDSGDNENVVASAEAAVRGGIEVPVGEQFYIYHADIYYVFDDLENQDEYVVTWFKNGERITSGVTNAELTVINKANGSAIVSAASMTEFGGIAAFRLDTAELQVKGNSYVVIAEATIDGSTRTYSWIQGRDAF